MKKQFLNNYKRATHTTIFEKYKNPSESKQIAENSIFNEMQKNSGYDYRVCGGNCMHFSCGYRMLKNDIEILVYHTAYNRYEIVFA